MSVLLRGPSFHLKGTGWYATDYANSGKKDKKDKKDSGTPPGCAGCPSC